jgi:hypothetical protein
MAVRSYIMTADFKSPYVTATGMAHDPSRIKFKQLKKGEIINGELKHANNKPAFVLLKGVCVVPLHVIKEVVTKEVISHADGEGSIAKKIKQSVGTSKNNSNPEVKYVDAMLIGAIVGLGGVYLAEKQGWIAEPDKKYKMYGALGGALLGMYYVYRSKTQKKSSITIKNE